MSPYSLPSSTAASPRSPAAPRARAARRAALALGLLVAALAGRPARAEDPPVSAPRPAPAPSPEPPAPATPPAPAPLPEGVVARVRGQDVTLADFRLALVDKVGSELADDRSGPATVLRIVIEELAVMQEADRLGIRVTNEDYARRYDEIDRQTRAKSGGTQSLADVIRAMNTPPEEFRARVEDMVRKDRIASHPSYLGATLPTDETARIAQVEVVIAELLRKTKVERPPGGDVIATVNGMPISRAKFGEQLYLRLADSEIRRHLREVCMTRLLDQEGLRFTADQVEEALQLERPLYERMVEEAIDPNRKSLSFTDFLTLRYGVPAEELKASPYRRGLFALRARFWKAATDADVVKQYMAGAQAEYGASIVGTDLTISFQNPKSVSDRDLRRTRAEALTLAADYVRRGRANETAEGLRKEIAAQKQRSIRAERRAVFHRGNDLPLFEALGKVADRSWSDPIEMISEFHVFFREVERPAPTFEKLRDVVRHDWVDDQARKWIGDALRDQVQTAR